MVFQAHFVNKNLGFFPPIYSRKINPEKDNHFYQVILYVRYSIFYCFFFFFTVSLPFTFQSLDKHTLSTHFMFSSGLYVRGLMIRYNPWPWEVFRLVGKIRIKLKTQLEKNTLTICKVSLLWPHCAIHTPKFFLFLFWLLTLV